MKKVLFLSALCALFGTSYADSDECAAVSTGSQMQTQPADWEITTKVKANLMTAPDLSASARLISVATNNGVVTLTGTVASKKESQKVVKLVKEVRGVKKVDNQLTVSKP